MPKCPEIPETNLAASELIYSVNVFCIDKQNRKRWGAGAALKQSIRVKEWLGQSTSLVRHTFRNFNIDDK